MNLLWFQVLVMLKTNRYEKSLIYLIVFKFIIVYYWLSDFQRFVIILKCFSTFPEHIPRELIIQQYQSQFSIPTTIPLIIFSFISSFYVIYEQFQHFRIDIWCWFKPNLNLLLRWYSITIWVNVWLIPKVKDSIYRVLWLLI
jgi:hypothetical protein